MASEVELKIKVPNQTQYLALIGSIGEAVAKEMCKLPESKEFCGNNLNVVVTEAMANAIKHANATDPDIHVTISININENELLVSVYDSGSGFDLNSIYSTELESAELKESGRGLFIIKSIMDSVVYKKVNDGNVLEMRKLLSWLWFETVNSPVKGETMPLDKKSLELVAIGASVGSGCDDWLEYHLKAAREAGATPGELCNAIRVSEKVRDVQIRKIEKFSSKICELITELSAENK